MTNFVSTRRVVIARLWLIVMAANTALIIAIITEHMP